MIARAVEHGVIYVAGEAFFVNGGGRNMVRLSFSAPPTERIVEGVTRLGETVRAELDDVSQSGGPSAARSRQAVP
jgi:2-aminoadipate transaminase